DVLRQVPVLWIWDNVDTVRAEQEELSAFLRDASAAGARFLLTARSGAPPRPAGVHERIPGPPPATPPQFGLAVAAPEQFRYRLPEARLFRPLVEFARGNPLAMVMAAGQAMREGLRSAPEFEGLAARMRLAESGTPDESRESAAPALAVALDYIYTSAFNDA